MKRRRRPRRGADPGAIPLYIQRAPHRRPGMLHPRVPGVCRVCAEPVKLGCSGRSRSWHRGYDGEPNCWESWRFKTRPKYAKQQLARKRGNRCELCYKRGRGYKWLHLDHKLPLADGGVFEENNLQLLCPECHGAKTADENSRRAKARRKTGAHGSGVGSGAVKNVALPIAYMTTG